MFLYIRTKCQLSNTLLASFQSIPILYPVPVPILCPPSQNQKKSPCKRVRTLATGLSQIVHKRNSQKQTIFLSENRVLTERRQ